MAWPIPEKIGGKDVYIVESHHHVLKCWAAIRQKLKSPPVLLTFDQHTDTRTAFARHFCGKGYNPITAAFDNAVGDRCKVLDFFNLSTIEDAVRDLAWDEHINAGIRGSIINFALVVCFDASYVTKRKTEPNIEEFCRFPEKVTQENFDRIPFAPYDMPPDRAFVVSQNSDLSNCDCAIESR